MSLGDRINFYAGSYEVRGMVDGRYVVRIRNRERNTETYSVWTEKERTEFDQKSLKRVENRERNAQVYERILSGESASELATEFGVSVSRIRQICVQMERKEAK